MIDPVTFDDALMKLYVERGLARAVDAPAHLPTACPRAVVCWKGVPDERRPAMGHPASELSPPHIGDLFVESRVVVLLENLREYGGFDFSVQEATRGMRYLTRCAAVGLARGSKVLFRGGGYAGSRVWHQALSYAACWLRSRGSMTFGMTGPGSVPAKAVAESLKHVALAQHVKCSPIGARSEQTAGMWEECGRYVLAGELGVLAPKALLVVGTGENAASVRAHLLPVLADRRAREVRIGSRVSSIALETRSSPTLGPVAVLFVPHPAAPGASSHALIDAFDELVTAAT